MAADEEVQVVYDGTVNPAHVKNVITFLTAGKPILCEKPLGVNVQETKKMIDLAREKKVFLMEAMWSRCIPAHQALKDEVQKGSIGELWHVKTIN